MLQNSLNFIFVKLNKIFKKKKKIIALENVQKMQTDVNDKMKVYFCYRHYVVLGCDTV